MQKNRTSKSIISVGYIHKMGNFRQFFKALVHRYPAEEVRTCQKEYQLAKAVLIPLLNDFGFSLDGLDVLDAGCGMGGSAFAVAESGAHCVAFDIDITRVKEAQIHLERFGEKIAFEPGDLCGKKLKFSKRFDLILMLDVIEHLKEPFTALQNCKGGLKKNGSIFISFPPWFSPYGGHQHHPNSIARFMPFVHLVPFSFYRTLLPQNDKRYLEEVDGLNRLTLSRFERLVNKAGLTITKRKLYILRPHFKYLYGLPPLQTGALGTNPLLREFLVGGAYFQLR